MSSSGQNRPVTDSDERTAVDKAMSLLTAFGPELQIGVGVTELARRAGMNKSTAFRILAMLERNRAVVKSGRLYYLGSTMHEIGRRAAGQDHHQLAELLTPYLVELYEATHLTLHLAVLHHSDVVYLNKLHGRDRSLFVPSRIGGRQRAGTTAVGKALLAYHPDFGCPDFGCSDDALAAELAGVRRNGVAHDHEQTATGLACVGAPILDRAGRAVAAISMSGSAAVSPPATHVAALRRACFRAGRAVAAQQARSRTGTELPVPAISRCA